MQNIDSFAVDLLARGENLWVYGFRTAFASGDLVVLRNLASAASSRKQAAVMVSLQFFFIVRREMRYKEVSIDLQP